MDASSASTADSAPSRGASTSGSAPVRQPRQDRSRRTLERLLDVTEELLEERPFEEISVGEIVRRAGTSVGAFYSRFRDKDALLPALYRRYDRWVGMEAKIARTAEPWAGEDLAGVVRWIVGEIATVFRTRRHLMKAMTLHARLRPDKIDRETRERRTREMSFLREALLSRRDEIGHPDPERAVDLAVFFTASAVRDAVLFHDAPHAESMRLTDDELDAELARQMLGYLSPIPSGASGSSGR
jgi:AcrR family transcriptional regulator